MYVTIGVRFKEDWELIKNKKPKFLQVVLSSATFKLISLTAGVVIISYFIVYSLSLIKSKLRIVPGSCAGASFYRLYQVRIFFTPLNHNVRHILLTGIVQAERSCL